RQAVRLALPPPVAHRWVPRTRRGLSRHNRPRLASNLAPKPRERGVGVDPVLRSPAPQLPRRERRVDTAWRRPHSPTRGWLTPPSSPVLASPHVYRSSPSSLRGRGSTDAVQPEGMADCAVSEITEVSGPSRQPRLLAQGAT